MRDVCRRAPALSQESKQDTRRYGAAYDSRNIGGHGVHEQVVARISLRD